MNPFKVGDLVEWDPDSSMFKRKSGWYNRLMKSHPSSPVVKVEGSILWFRHPDGFEWNCAWDCFKLVEYPLLDLTKPLRMRDGRPVTVLSTDDPGERPVRVRTEEGHVYHYLPEGFHYKRGFPQPIDLVNA